MKQSFFLFYLGAAVLCADPKGEGEISGSRYIGIRIGGLGGHGIHIHRYTCIRSSLAFCIFGLLVIGQERRK
ncbi:hypothetical protein DFP73DRAFT_544194 [Morchella snyderi]|nr:hypothetical protein DFP73DRAFT_544194 [Morchella snyderi]